MLPFTSVLALALGTTTFAQAVVVVDSSDAALPVVKKDIASDGFGQSSISLGSQGVVVLDGSSATLPIVNKMIAPDGFSRSAVLAGGTFPGPLITASPTTQFNINVINQLTDKTMNLTTSVHWHGLKQQKTTYYDGTSMVTQCPIVPNENFMYDFSANGQAGTYWYHSHQAAQYCDGLRGPLVIYDPNDPYKTAYDVDDGSTTIITLADWYHTVSPQQSQPASSQATLINGLGRSFANPGNNSLAVITVTQNKRYRFRIVSLSCDPYYMFSIDQHNMTIIEADGTNTQKLTVDKIQVFAAQRYSVILNANQNIGNYWIRALPNNPPNANFEGYANMAILRYVDAPASYPESSDTSKTTLREQDVKPFNSPPVPGGHSLNASDVYQVNLIFSATFNPKTGAGAFFVNGTTYSPPMTPVLAQLLSPVIARPQNLPTGSVIPLSKNTTVQISMQLSGPVAQASGPHPLHLHGHNFYVVQAAGQTSPNFVDPPVRDVVSVGPATTSDPVVVRFVTDNAGPWFFHCHIDWHLLAGFAVVFAEDTPDIPAFDQPPAEWFGLCPAYNTYTANGGSG